MTNKTLKHSYFISYHYGCAKTRISGFGSIGIETSKPLKPSDLVDTKELIETRIKESTKVISPHVVILNIIKMKG